MRKWLSQWPGEVDNSRVTLEESEGLASTVIRRMVSQSFIHQEVERGSRLLDAVNGC